MSNDSQIIDVEAGLPAREQLRLHLEMQTLDGLIVAARLSGIGCRETLDLLAKWRPKLQGVPLKDVELPEGTTHSEVLLRELLLRAQGQWRFPYADDEICHCRGIPTAKVDAAIVAGCHTVQAVRAATSANTSCGACRGDIEKVIAYRLSKSNGS